MAGGKTVDVISNKLSGRLQQLLKYSQVFLVTEKLLKISILDNFDGLPCELHYTVIYRQL